ncbi:MAG: hypothetical protein ACJ8G5_02360 [Burkholderiales bacterium]
MAGSCVVEDDEPLGLGLLGDELLAPPLGELELLLEELGLLGLLGPLAPPEALPDLGVSLEADPLMPEDELDEDGLDGLDEAPPDGDEDELLGEGELLGEDDVLELEEPGLDELLLALSRSHAARPRARATATAIADSFMCPPWLGCY